MACRGEVPHRARGDASTLLLRARRTAYRRRVHDSSLDRRRPLVPRPAEHGDGATTEQTSQSSRTPSHLVALQRAAGNHAVAGVLALQRQPLSPAGAEARSREIDEEVRSDPSMPLARLEQLLRERDRLLPLLQSPPAPAVGPPAPATTSAGSPAADPTSRWAPVEPSTMPGALPIAAGMVIVPVTSGPPPVPPSVLFPELLGAAEVEAGAATAELTTAAVATTEVGGALVTTEVAGAAAAAGGSATIPVAGWVVAGVIVIGIAGYLVYRHYSVPAGPPTRVEAPGAPGSGPVTAPGTGNRAPAVLPGAPLRGPASAPAADRSGPVSLPGARRPDGPLLMSGLPTNRTDFPTREAALRRALELARTLILNDLELIEEAQNFGAPEERGTISYYKGRGSTAEMRGSEPRGNIVAIVEHTSDPTQPPHLHVVRPPTSGPRIEHGGIYSEPFAGTPDQHLTIRTPSR